MEKYFPASFSEVLAGTLVLFALISAGLSLIPCLRAHTLRLLAIFFVTALALFSNNVSTYFVAIFVIATAVTELEFLQNLAAIVRGNKEYFDYKKEALSKERKLDILAAEVAQAAVVVGTGVNGADEDDSSKETHASNSENSSGEFASDVPLDDSREAENIDNKQIPEDVVDLKPELRSSASGKIETKTNSSRYKTSTPKITLDIRRIYELEARALDGLERSYKGAIERGVRLRGEKDTVELDGLVVSRTGRDIVFEVKYLATSRNFLSWINFISLQLERTILRYKSITGKDALIHFVLILEDGVVLSARQRAALNGLKFDEISILSAGSLAPKS